MGSGISGMLLPRVPMRSHKVQQDLVFTAAPWSLRFWHGQVLFEQPGSLDGTPDPEKQLLTKQDQFSLDLVGS